MIVELPIREDDWGSGKFGSKRRDSKGNVVEHKGIDFECPPGADVWSPASGEVTKLGYAYKDDLSYRYVQITDSKGMRHRIFYVSPSVIPGQRVVEGQPIGKAQDISKRYKTVTIEGDKIRLKFMKPHAHYEILDKQGKPINPEEYL